MMRITDYLPTSLTCALTPAGAAFRVVAAAVVGGGLLGPAGAMAAAATEYALVNFRRGEYADAHGRVREPAAAAMVAWSAAMIPLSAVMACSSELPPGIRDDSPEAGMAIAATFVGIAVTDEMLRWTGVNHFPLTGFLQLALPVFSLTEPAKFLGEDAQARLGHLRAGAIGMTVGPIFAELLTSAVVKSLSTDVSERLEERGFPLAAGPRAADPAVSERGMNVRPVGPTAWPRTAASDASERAMNVWIREEGENAFTHFRPEQEIPMSARAALLREHRLEDVPEEDILWYLPDPQLGPPERLGEGTYNSVFAIEYTRRDGKNFLAAAKPFQAVCKALGGLIIGIPEEKPQAEMRNRVTDELARKLGFDVVAQNRIGWYWTAGKMVPVLVMERAKGTLIRDVPREWLRGDPEVAKRSGELQLLDLLTCQIDRHIENYFWYTDEQGRARLTGIDNDLCLGTWAKLNDNDMVDRTGLRKMPPVVDSSMASALGELTPEDLDKIVGTRLKDPEVLAAAKTRLETLQAHIARLSETRHLPLEQRCLIEPDEWALHLHKLTTINSYYALAVAAPVRF